MPELSSVSPGVLERPVGLVERLLVLRALPTFAELPDRELAVIANACTERVVRAGQALLTEGEPVEAIHAVVDGRVKLTSGGRFVGVSRADVGMGTIGALARMHGELSAVAEVDTLALELRTDALLDILEDDFLVMARLLRRVAGVLSEDLRQLRRDRWVPEIPPHALPDARELDLVGRLFFIRMSAAFAAASLDGVAQFAKLLEQVYYARGEELWREGDPSDGLVLVVDGVVRCGVEGRPSCSRYGPTGILGGIDVLADRPRWGSAVCETPVTGLRADREALLDVMEDNFDLALDFLTMMARMVIELRRDS